MAIYGIVLRVFCSSLNISATKIPKRYIFLIFEKLLLFAFLNGLFGSLFIATSGIIPHVLFFFPNIFAMNLPKRCMPLIFFLLLFFFIVPLPFCFGVSDDPRGPRSTDEPELLAPIHVPSRGPSGRSRSPDVSRRFHMRGLAEPSAIPPILHITIRRAARFIGTTDRCSNFKYPRGLLARAAPKLYQPHPVFGRLHFSTVLNPLRQLEIN